MVDYEKDPIAINQIIVHDRNIRSHFISILYKCFLTRDAFLDNRELSITDPGYLMWYDKCPDDLLQYHDIYREFI